MRNPRRVLAISAVSCVAVVAGYVALGHWLGNRGNMAMIGRFAYERCASKASQARPGMTSAELSDLGFHLVHDRPAGDSLQGYSVLVPNSYPSDLSQPIVLTGAYPAPEPTQRLELAPGEELYRRICSRPDETDPLCGQSREFIAIIGQTGTARAVLAATTTFCE